MWPDVLDPDAVREARAMKARTEELLRQQGISDRELKRGPGGIRDIEFAVQLLQLVHGRHDPSVRSRSTLEALEQLAAGGYVSASDPRARRGVRLAAHRRTPVAARRGTADAHAARRARRATRLARVLGFRDTLKESAVEAFEARHRAQQAVVRAIHEKLFFAPLLDTLAGAGPLTPAAAEERLTAFGFQDIDRTAKPCAS